MERKMTCIICPLGCQLTVQLQRKNIESITGNTCPRGKAYAESECLNPQRTITTTVRCSDGTLVSVKTETPVPKDKIMDCMAIINNITATLPVAIGDVLLEDLFGSRVVATQNRI